MSISDKIQALETSRQAIATAITQKGGTVAQGDGFSQFATEISNLPSGGSGNPLLTSIDVSDFSGTTFNKATSYITDVTIPSGVTSIDNNAFQYCSSLTSITIPSGVTTIGNYAFQDCPSLTSITIPSGVTTIGDYAFGGCIGLTSITIPSGVTTIGGQAFSSCRGLKSIILPSSVTNIGSNVVNGTSGYLLYFVVLSTTPPTLGNNGFNNSTCNIYVPAESVDAYKAANNWSKYASRIYPIQQVATVDGNPVYNYEIGDTDGAVIGSGEMSKMPTGTSLELAEGITSVQGVINGYTTVSLPSTISYLGVQEVIGSSVTTLTCLADTPPSVQVNNLGGSNLTAIFVPAASVDTYKAAGGWSTHSSIIQAVTYRLATLTLSDNTEVEITSDTPTLTRALVSTPYNSTLVSASIAPDTTTINDRAFYNCTLMTSVTFESGSACEIIYTRAFYGCSGLTSITLPDTVTSIGDYAFQGTALTSITIPSGVTSIGSNAFKTTALTSITIPDSVAEIGSYAFMACESLESATIGNGVETIGAGAFSTCPSLESVTIGSGLTMIGTEVFLECESLTSVTMLGETPPELEEEGGDPFAIGGSGINTLYVPSASVSAYQTWVEEILGADTITVEAIPAE